MIAQSPIPPNLSSLLGKMPHAIWRASEMAVYKASTICSGFKDLDAELPNVGWPRSSLIELLVQQAGICALLNSFPMGFYSRSALVQDGMRKSGNFVATLT
ncbi:hypothetical protein [Undibacterium sp. TJN19]|uniref:hypothetical protein n=1 Tax=Undibacterium sp. TJN19 TaxID=3413055 RepID=UPI003BF03523